MQNPRFSDRKRNFEYLINLRVNRIANKNGRLRDYTIVRHDVMNPMTLGNRMKAMGGIGSDVGGMTGTVNTMAVADGRAAENADHLDETQGTRETE